LGHYSAAAGYLRQALELSQVRSEQSFLRKRIEECEQAAAGPKSNLVDQIRHQAA
jgi:hypothetical protein